MTYQVSATAIGIFIFFVLTVLGLSFFFARKTKSASGYYAAGGQIHWAVNGIAFAGDYLSAASFLGICGMIAFFGYDGFLYSIGYLAGWIVALVRRGRADEAAGQVYVCRCAGRQVQLARASSWRPPSARWSCRSST